MKINLISTMIGYVILAIVFLPLLVIKNVLWIGFLFLLFILASIILGQLIKSLINDKRRKK